MGYPLILSLFEKDTMPDYDVTKMTFLGIRERIKNDNGFVYGEETLEISHPWKAFSEEKELGDSTGTAVLCWDATTDCHAPNFLYLGFRVRKSITYSELGRDEKSSGLKLGEFGESELAEWTALLKTKFEELGIAGDIKLHESTQEDIG